MNEGGIATEGLKYRVGKRVSRMAICTSVTLLGLSLLVFLPSTIDELLKNGASFFAILGLFLTLGTFWLGSPSMIAWWRIRPHRKQWDLAATEPPSGLAAHSKQEPTYSRDLVGPAFHLKNWKRQEPAGCLVRPAKPSRWVCRFSLDSQHPLRLDRLSIHGYG